MNVTARKAGRQLQASASRANEIGQSAEIHISAMFQFRNGVLPDLQALGQFGLREMLRFAQFRKRQFLEHGLSARLASRPAFGRHFFLQFSEISRHIISPTSDAMDGICHRWHVLSRVVFRRGAVLGLVLTDRAEEKGAGMEGAVGKGWRNMRPGLWSGLCFWGERALHA